MDSGKHRFFICKEDINNEEISIGGSDARHIYSSLRLSAGEKIVVCDGRGMDYLCELTSISQHGARARILSSGPNEGEPGVKITLYQSLPRADKFEYVIQKCVEAGVYKILPVLSEFAQYHDRAKGEGGKRLLERWRRIAHEAAKQSGRGIIPEIGGFIRFTDAVSACSSDQNIQTGGKITLIAYEYEDDKSLKSELISYKERQFAAPINFAPRIHLFIGPEGGFSKDEIDMCERGKIIPITLGRRILRTETAGLFALSQIMYEFEQ